MPSETVSWEMVNQAFAPFTGTCLYAIRADAFFHFALHHSDVRRFYAKNLSYPLMLAWRARKFSFHRELSGSGRYLFVSDYLAEPGFGSIRPLLVSCDAPATVVVNTAVFNACRAALKEIGASVVCADVHPASPDEWRGLWQRSHADYQRLLASASPNLQSVMRKSRLVLRALLMRAYLYEHLYERLFWIETPRAVITHNDFTSLSYLAGATARRYGVPDFTLQHGFPSQEYFPASASHYLLWGPAFRKSFRRALHPPRNGGATRFASVGAPRLDTTVSTEHKQSIPAGENEVSRPVEDRPLRVLFLSQSHTSVFTMEEHRKILALISALTDEPWLQLSIRQHPQESQRAFRRHTGFKHARFLSQKMSLKDSVLAADVVLAVNSTAMLEAALLQAPVVQIVLPGFEKRLGVLQFPWQVHNLVSARSVLRQLRRMEERRMCAASQQTLVRECISTPGEGTETAWRYIRAFEGSERPLTANALQGTH